MHEPTPHLFRSKRRQSRPLKPIIRQPQLRVRGIDFAVAGLGVGDEDAAGGDPVFGFFLEAAPQAVAGQQRDFDAGFRVGAGGVGFALAGGQLAGAVPEFFSCPGRLERCIVRSWFFLESQTVQRTMARSGWRVATLWVMPFSLVWPLTMRPSAVSIS